MSASNCLLELLLHLLPLVVGELLEVHVEGVRPQQVVLGEARLLAGREVLHPAVERLAQLQHPLLALGLVGVDLLLDLGLQ